MAVESIDISIAVQVSSLKKRLRMDKSDRMVGDWLARSFLKAMVALIGKSVLRVNHSSVSITCC